MVVRIVVAVGCLPALWPLEFVDFLVVGLDVVAAVTVDGGALVVICGRLNLSKGFPLLEDSVVVDGVAASSGSDSLESSAAATSFSSTASVVVAVEEGRKPDPVGLILNLDPLGTIEFRTAGCSPGALLVRW